MQVDRLRSQLSSSSDSGLGEESGGESGDPRLARLTALAGGLQSRLPPAKQEQLTRAIATARTELHTEPSQPQPSKQCRRLRAGFLISGLILVNLAMAWLYQPACCETQNTLAWEPRLQFVGGPQPY